MKGIIKFIVGLLLGYLTITFLFNFNLPQFWNIYDGGFKVGKTYIGVDKNATTPFGDKKRSPVRFLVLETSFNHIKVKDANGNIRSSNVNGDMTAHWHWNEKKD